jgi:tetratricopeptide (TPR) repeat protein
MSEIQAALDAGDLARAGELAEAAITAGARDPGLYRLRGDALSRQGAYEPALDWLDQGVALAPRDVPLLMARARLLNDIDRRAEAMQGFQAVLALAPNLAEAHFGLGESLGAFGEVADARTCYELALRLKPNYPDAQAALATLLARTGEAAAARPYAERALAAQPGHLTATFALAVADVADKAYSTAALRLSALIGSPGLEPVLRASCLCLMGDAFHGQGRTRQAFDAWTRGKALFERIYAPTYGEAAQATSAFIARMADYFADAPAEPWRAAPEPQVHDDDPMGHAFLVGFNRSGTTLLEQVLAAHPRIVALEERPLMVLAERAFMLDRAGLEALAEIGSSQAELFRRAYWQAVRDNGVEPAGKLFVDKVPLNVVNLPLIAKLFPKARILFARRDPRDVVLSCFRHAFSPNGANFLMLSLEGAAGLYDRVMALDSLYRGRLALPVHEIRYERLVGHFEAECRAICAFLGVDWDPAMADFAATARERTIATPSAGQVRQGLYSGGEGQWRAYREEMAPVLPTLKPWVERFGYPTD